MQSRDRLPRECSGQANLLREKNVRVLQPVPLDYVLLRDWLIAKRGYCLDPRGHTYQ